MNGSADRLPLIGERAPAFTADSTQGPIHFPDDFKGKWVVFFSHPADFTPVCTTEFMAFAAAADEFKQLNAELLGSDEYKVATPANWRVGEDVIISPPGSTELAEERVEKAGTDYRCLDWFLCLRKYPGKLPA